MTNDLAAYYAARAAEYEWVYAKPERQRDLATLRHVVAEFFRGCDVLEVACGTAYWTAEIANTAKSVTATDVGAEVLDIARSKEWPRTASVRFAVADAYDLGAVSGRFNAGFAGFWWSHVPRQSLSAFLTGFHRHLGPDSRVMVLDNRYVQGSSTPVARIDEHGNSFQQRALSSGAVHEVLKNFPGAREVRDILAQHGASDLEVTELPHYWYANYTATNR